jgi:hypothetical protein
MKRQLLVLLALASACGSGTAPPAGKPALAIDLFKAAPATIALGESSQLVFAATAATKLTIDPGGIDVTGKSSLTVTPTADTTYTLTATDGAATASQTASVTVTQARPAAFRVTASGAAVAGSETTFSVAALGASGAVDANYHGTVRFSTDDPQGAVPGQIVFQAADAGQITIKATFKTAGTRTLAAADVAVATAQGTAQMQVASAAAARLELSGVPASAAAGERLALVVTALDPFDNIATGYVGSVHFSSTDAGALLPADFAFTPADDGTHSFAVVLSNPGTPAITVSAAGLSAGTAQVAVRHGSAALLTIEGLPAQVVVGTPFNLTVTVRDASGNPATDYTGTLHFTSSDPQFPAVPDATFAAADLGVRIVAVQFATAGTQSLSASDTSTPSIAGTAATLAGHGAAARLALSGLPSFAVAGSLLTATVSVRDAHGNPVTDFTGTLQFSSSDGTAQLPADFSFSAADLGLHPFALVLTKVGNTTVTVSTAGLPSTSASVAVLGGAARVTLEGLPAQVTVDTTQNVTVTVRDGSGNAVTGYTGTLHFTSSDPLASSIPDTTFVPLNLGVLVVAVRFGTAGVQSLSASDTVTPSLAGTASAQIIHGPAARLVLTGLPASTVAGALLTATVAAVDAHGNVATDFTGTVHFSSSDPSATLPVDAAFNLTDAGVRIFPVALLSAGARSVSIGQVSGTVTGATAPVVVGNAPASRIAINAHATQVAVDTSAVFTITILDRFGNPAADYRGTVHFISTDPAATGIADVTFVAVLNATKDVSLQFGTTGEQSLLASDTVDAALTSSAVIQVTAGPAESYALLVLPSSAVAGEPLPLTITAVDVHGNLVPGYAGAASVASIDPSDLLPAAGGFVNGVRTVSLAFVTAGQHHATISEVGGTFHLDTSTVAVVSGDASALVMTAAAATAGAPSSIGVAVKDAFGNIVVSYAGTVSLTSTDTQATLPPAFTFTGADAGRHTFSATFRTAGTWSVTAADGANTLSEVTNVLVVAASAANCDLSVIAKAGTDVAVRVRVLDPFANLATGYRGTLSLSSSDAAAQLPAPATYTSADAGSRDFSAVLPSAGDQTIRASDAAAPFSCQATVSIASGQFFALAFAAGPEAWAGTAQTVTAQAQDAAGTAITNYAGTIVFSSSDPAAVLPASVTLNGSEGGHATVNVTFKTLGLQTFTAKDSADATKIGTALQLVHGLVYSDPALGGMVRLVLNSAASTTSTVQLDLVSNTSLFPLGLSDPLSSGRVLPSTVRNGVFAAGMNLPLDSSKIEPDPQLLVLPAPSNAILGLGATPQAVGAALTNGVLYSGISQKRFDATLNCTSCTNDHQRGDVQVRPFPAATSLYYSVRVKLTPGAVPGVVFDGQALASNTKFRAAVRDRSGTDVFAGTADFAIGRLEVK